MPRWWLYRKGSILLHGGLFSSGDSRRWRLKGEGALFIKSNDKDTNNSFLLLLPHIFLNLSMSCFSSGCNRFYRLKWRPKHAKFIALYQPIPTKRIYSCFAICWWGLRGLWHVSLLLVLFQLMSFHVSIHLQQLGLCRISLSSAELFNFVNVLFGVIFTLYNRFSFFLEIKCFQLLVLVPEFLQISRYFRCSLFTILNLAIASRCQLSSSAPKTFIFGSE